MAVKLVPVMREAISAMSRESRVDCRWRFGATIRGRWKFVLSRESDLPMNKLNGKVVPEFGEKEAEELKVQA